MHGNSIASEERMIEYHMKYQANVFVQAAKLQPTPELMSALTDLFKDLGFLPGTMYEMGGGQMGPRPRPRLSTPDNEWNIEFRSDRILCQKNATHSGGGKLGPLGDFCQEARDMLGKGLEKLGKHGTRLALVTTVMLREMTPTELKEAYRRFFEAPEFFVEQEPFEWNWRSAAQVERRVGPFTETLNVIGKSGRFNGQLQIGSDVTPFDRIQVELDINTIPDTDETRFGGEHLQPFFVEAIAVHDRIQDEILEKLSV